MYWYLRRNQTWLTRLLFTLVILTGLAGMIYVGSRFTITPADLTFDLAALESEDVVDQVAAILEWMVQIFQAITAPA